MSVCIRIESGSHICPHKCWQKLTCEERILPLRMESTLVRGIPAREKLRPGFKYWNEKDGFVTFRVSKGRILNILTSYPSYMNFICTPKYIGLDRTCIGNFVFANYDNLDICGLRAHRLQSQHPVCYSEVKRFGNRSQVMRMMS